MTPVRAAAFGLAALALSACATTRAPSDPENPLEQPARDVGLVQATPPELLQRAVRRPYAPVEGCFQIRAEIAALNAVLGPDVDADQEEQGHTADLAGDILGSLIPYRSIVRRLSGAAERDAEMEQAVTAGVARRGFLKGLARANACPPAG